MLKSINDMIIPCTINRLPTNMMLPNATIQSAGLPVRHIHQGLIIHSHSNVRCEKKSTCSFCGCLSHRVSHCGVRELLKMSSSKSVLSSEYPKIADVLRERMKNAVMVNPNNTKGSVVATLAKNLYQRNFVIHEVGVVYRD